MSEYVKISELIQSKTADEDEKGNIVFNKIKEMTVSQNASQDIVLDFSGIELVNTAFLNNAIGKLYDASEYDLEKNSVRIMNMDNTMLDLLKESISVAREKYVN